MKLLVTRLLLAALAAGQFALLGVMRADARTMACCPSMSGHGSSAQPACPPAGAAANSCCVDCPYLIGAMLPAESDDPLRVHRPQVAVFPSVEVRASRRVEQPPVPPPRGWAASAPGSTLVGRHQN